MLEMKKRGIELGKYATNHSLKDRHHEQRLKKFTVLVFPVCFGLILPQLLSGILSMIYIRLNQLLALVGWYAFALFFLLKYYDYCWQQGYLKPSYLKLLKGTCLGISLVGFEWIFSTVFPKADGATIDEHAVPIMLLAVCVFAPLWEEVVFRGILNAKIFKKRFVGVLISSILFAVLHGYVSPAMLFYFCLGIAFSLVNRDQTDVFTSVVAHMSFNVIVLILTLSS